MVTNKIKKLALFMVLSIMIVVTASPLLAYKSLEPQWPKIGYNNLNTGQVPYLGPQKNITKWNHGINGIINYPPVIGRDGTIYISSFTAVGRDYGNITAVNPNGTLKWTYNIMDGDSNSISAVAMGPDGNIYFSSGFFEGEKCLGKLYSLYPNGTVRWKWSLGDGKHNVWFGSSPLIGPDGTIYFSSLFSDDKGDFGRLYALTLNKTVKWGIKIPASGYCMPVMSSPALKPDGTIYFTTGFEANGRTYGGIYAVNSLNGSLKWNKTFKEGKESTTDYSPSVATDGTIYIATKFKESKKGRDFGRIQALTPDGKSKWSYTIAGGKNSYICSSPVLGIDGTIYFASIIDEGKSRGYLNALNPNRTIKWTKKITEGTSSAILSSSPAIGLDGTIYFVGRFEDQQGNDHHILYALNRDGTLKWNKLFSERAITGGGESPVISKEGTLYFGGSFREGNPEKYEDYSFLFAISGK